MRYDHFKFTLFKTLTEIQLVSMLSSQLCVRGNNLNLYLMRSHTKELNLTPMKNEIFIFLLHRFLVTMNGLIHYVRYQFINRSFMNKH